MRPAARIRTNDGSQGVQVVGAALAELDGHSVTISRLPGQGGRLASSDAEARFHSKGIAGREGDNREESSADEGGEAHLDGGMGKMGEKNEWYR
jgi:hypothetical protein